MADPKIITIFSTKGGVGKSVLAVNLAATLAKDLGKKTLLIDLDMQAVGDISSMLNINPQKTLGNYLDFLKKKSQDPKNTQELDISSLVLKHSSGLDFIAAILRPRQAPHIESTYIREALLHFAKNYEYVIVDAGKTFTEVLLSSFSVSNLILMVLTPDILSIYQTKWSLDVLQTLHLPLKMVRAVLNRSHSIGGVDWQEVHSALPVDVISYVPSEGKAMGLAVNRKIPIVIDAPRTRAAVAMKQLANDLIKKEDLFVKQQDLSNLKMGVPENLSTGVSFWLSSNLTEPLAEIKETKGDEIIELKKRVHERILLELNLKHMDLKMMSSQQAEELKKRTERAISNALAEETNSLIDSFEVRRLLIKEISDEALGLGPLEDLINDAAISDILVNGKNQIYIERHGKLELTTKRFISNEQVRQVIERIIAPLGRRIDESTPMVDARLSDGSRVNAIIPPLSLVGPTLSIRKFGRERYNIDDLIQLNTLTDSMKDFIKACVASRKNIVVSGGTGSGKTTVLNVLSAFIPENERIITIEDAAELQLKQDHWVRLESRPPNIEGRGAVSSRDLFRNALRMRPDRIVIGECRGAESLDMLQAMNTGHDGSMTTIHANSTQDVLSRLDSMILMSGAELPIRAIREMISSAIHIIIHTSRLSDGSRKVMQISELTGMLDDVHIGLKDIFIFKQTGIDEKGSCLGSFQPTGYIPTFVEDFKVRGISFSPDMFKVRA